MKRLEYDIYDFNGDNLILVGLIKVVDFIDEGRRIHSLLHLGEYYPIVKSREDEKYGYIIDEEMNYEDCWDVDADVNTGNISIDEVMRTVGVGIKVDFYPLGSKLLKQYSYEFLDNADDDAVRLSVDIDENSYEVELI